MRTRKLFEPSPALALIEASARRESSAECVRRRGRLPRASAGPALPSEPAGRTSPDDPPHNPARPGTPSLCETADGRAIHKPSMRTSVSVFPKKCAVNNNH